MTISPGKKLGPYEIVGLLGAGGMGEVYRAKDTRLERAVAVKMVSRSFANDTDRLRRFELEARTVAALNHPNILGIHDIGSYEGAPYLVSELLEGETLREKLEAGALGVRRATEYALGIARGLATAHEKGIVHRDLKPENVFIARDGQVKILDFGLAKLMRSDAGVDSTLLTNQVETRPGMVLGTMGYISPEQVRCEACDARSDIFSLGAVLYEMLTGKRAFKRETAAETMTAILREEPPELSETGCQVPPGMQRIIARCLEKSVERRFQSASDLGFAIESLSGTGATQSLERVKEKRAWCPSAAAAAGVLGVAGLAGLVAARWPREAMPRFTRLTYHQGYPTNARFAKDGHTVVYSAQWSNEPLQVFCVRVEYPQSSKVDLPSAALLAVSSAGDLALALDLRYHANFLSGTLAQAPMAGGSPRGLEKRVVSADFAPDGNTLAFAQHANGKVRVEFPPGKVIYETSGYVDYVRVAPSGQMVAFADHPVYDDDRGWVAVVDSAGKQRRLTGEFATVQGLSWAKGGEEIWFTGEDQRAESQVYAVNLSGKLRRVLSAPERMRVLDVTADGRVLLTSEQFRLEIAGVDPATGKERRGLEWFNGSVLTDVSPDGKAVLFSEWGGANGRLYEVEYRKLDGSAPVGLGSGAVPVFSPDGTTAAALLMTIPPQIAAVADRNRGKPEIVAGGYRGGAPSTLVSRRKASADRGRDGWTAAADV